MESNDPSTTAYALSQKYQKKTDKQHILDNPDTYIGSVENVDADMWIFDDESQKIILKSIHFIPGIFKLYDEAIVNCRDHFIRMLQLTSDDKHEVSYIKTQIITESGQPYPPGTIIMENDGNGIDIEKHPEYDTWIPEMIFGHLRTSTNYDKNEKRIVGGKNGFGVKLVFIWSVYGYIETVDHKRNLKYKQEFCNNLDEIKPPVITKAPKNAKPYTKIVFTPDYTRFGLPEGLTPDMISLFKKRVYDIAAVSTGITIKNSTEHSTTSSQKKSDVAGEANKSRDLQERSAGKDQLSTVRGGKLKILFNGSPIPIHNFQQYIDLYVGNKTDTKRVYESANENWEYAVALSSTHEFVQISFVNGISTFKGGKHVEYILGQIVRKLCDFIEKKKKVKVNPNSIKEQIILFIRCDVENPSFDSQTKDYMNTPISKFGTSCSISDSFIEKIAKMGVMDLACSLTEAKESRMSKKTDGTKTKTIRGIANFIDANLSGTAKSKDCILILCEGLSAMSGIISGLSSEDRNIIGIYPLKGKLLNVRGEQIRKINENKEIGDIKKILGLESGKEYRDINDVHNNLRYGKIMYMTDSDADGSHIKGLCINLFHSEWSSLIRIPGFLSFMNTPILRAKKGNSTLLFYNQGEYETWKNSTPLTDVHKWTIKYYKGLGTSTSTEFKEYFANKKIVDFVYTETTSDENIDKVFNKKRADDRKTWLEQYNKQCYLDTSRPSVRYEEFIDQELIHFSTYDCARSIPNMVDGLKISLRKILYCAFKRNLTSEVKVAQFSGYVSENSSYHHGEASLNGAIVNMAQTFVGSNNINLLEPLGQFGSRNFGGNDSASERYIFTHLNPLTRTVFSHSDDNILNYLDDDGTIVEPEYYCPIIPFVLVNGISGIGTGFSCNIPPFNPIQIIQYIKQKLHSSTLSSDESRDLPERSVGKDQTSEAYEGQFLPYYEGFKGTIEKVNPQKFLLRGVYNRVDEDSVLITELPIGTWTMPYITFLEELTDGVVDKNGKRSPPVIKDFVNLSTELFVNIKIIFPKDRLSQLSNEDLEKILKLTTTESITNMYLFDAECKLHKYNTVEEIIDSFYEVRMKFYEKRKNHLIENLEHLLVKLNNRAKYIQLNLTGEVDLRRKSNEEVTHLLISQGLEKWSSAKSEEPSFDYLIKMPMNSVTSENADKIIRERDEKQNELNIIRSTPIVNMWLQDLDKLENEYLSYKLKREHVHSPSLLSGEDSKYSGKSSSKTNSLNQKPKRTAKK
jgi:DNA topoisomerase-2